MENELITWTRLHVLNLGHDLNRKLVLLIDSSFLSSFETLGTAWCDTLGTSLVPIRPQGRGRKPSDALRGGC